MNEIAEWICQTIGPGRRNRTVYEGVGRYDLAIHYYLQAQELDPANGVAAAGLSRIKNEPSLIAPSGN